MWVYVYVRVREKKRYLDVETDNVGDVVVLEVVDVVAGHVHGVPCLALVCAVRPCEGNELTRHDTVQIAIFVSL